MELEQDNITAVKLRVLYLATGNPQQTHNDTHTT